MLLRKIGRLLVTTAAAAGLVLPIVTCAQELEPRAYSARPVGTNFVLGNYTRLSGEVSTDPALPITDVQAKIDIYSVGYLRSFAFAGRSASAAFIVPYVRADVTGEVFDAAREAHRSALGDVRLRFTTNLVGDPAVGPKEFAQRAPAPVVGASLSVVVPTGQYDSARLVNVGANRWAFKPEIGVALPLGQWFADASAGVWLFTDNTDFFGGHRRAQHALSVYQVHAGYNFAPGVWLAANAAYSSGGRTVQDGVEGNDVQQNSRVGVTVSLPLGAGWSTKLAWSKGVATRIAGDFEVIGVTLQYRWFDR
jgi:Putative MetA-pathway of phenol degradation